MLAALMRITQHCYQIVALSSVLDTCKVSNSSDFYSPVNIKLKDPVTFILTTQANKTVLKKTETRHYSSWPVSVSVPHDNSSCRWRSCSVWTTRWTASWRAPSPGETPPPPSPQSWSPWGSYTRWETTHTRTLTHIHTRAHRPMNKKLSYENIYTNEFH